MKRYPIKGYEGEYSITKCGKVWSHKQNKWRVATKSGKNGILQLHLSRNNLKIYYRIHTLMAETFLPNPNNCRCVIHINKIKNDNRLENLKWGYQGRNN